MTSSPKIVDPQEIQATDAQASTLMHQGMDLMQTGNGADALPFFDEALELRKRLPTEVPIHAYGLAACWLNRAEALTLLGPAHHEETIRAYDEGLALLRPLPLADDPRFAKRLAIAYQNRALILVSKNPPAIAYAIANLTDAVATLEGADAMDPAERNYLLAITCMNLANIQVLENKPESDLAARDGARRALDLAKAYEQDDPSAAEIGLKARHVLCQIAARRLSGTRPEQTMSPDVHEATDHADEGLDLIREWERRGVEGFRPLASDLLRFGARVYAFFQPQFLRDFLTDQLDPEQSTQAYVQSPEIQEAALDVVVLLPKSQDA